jgi:hypothetical protein
VVFAAVDEANVGAEQKIADGARREHLVRAGEARYPSPDAKGEACRFGVDEAFAGVNADPHLQSEMPDFVADRARALDGEGRSTERCEAAIARVAKLTPVVAAQFFSDQRVVLIEQESPGVVADAYESSVELTMSVIKTVARTRMGLPLLCGASRLASRSRPVRLVGTRS